MVAIYRIFGYFCVLINLRCCCLTWHRTWRPNPKNFKKGDLVVAKCNEDGKRYTAIVQENAGKGTVTVQYVEDETEEDVLLDNMWLQKKKFKKGQKVEAQFPDDGEWYSATVKEMVSSGKYLVEYLGPASSQATCKAGERRQ